MKQDITYELVNTKEQTPTIAVTADAKKQFLHSKIYPSKEAKQYHSQFNPEKHDVLIVLGLGLGYHLIDLAEHAAHYKDIIIVDIISHIENEISSDNKAAFLLEQRNVTILSGASIAEITERLQAQIQLEGTKGLAVLEHTNSLRIFPEYYLRVKDVVAAIIQKQAGNIATMQSFAKQYIRNILENIHQLHRFKSITKFKSAFADNAAIVVIPGPSLDSNIQKIKELQQQLFVIAVDSSVAVLAQYKIVPDFIVSIDPQPYIYEHLMQYPMQQSIYIFSIASSNRVFSSYDGFVTLNTHPLSQLLQQLRPDIDSIESATGTVAGDAVAFASFAGFDRVFIAGLDSAFLDYAIYARGSTYQHRYANILNNRLQPVESFNADYIFTASRAVKHDGIYTRNSFIQYKQSIEQMVKDRGITNLWQIQPCGLQLDGVSKVTDLLASDFVEIDKRQKLESVIAASTEIGISFIKDYKAMLLSPGVLEQVIEAALGNKTIEKDYQKVKRMIQKIL